MTRSMTGFARVTATGDWGELAWELRSVNHRYLDINLRLPEALRALEGDFRQQATASLGRGKVECTLHLRSGQTDSSLNIDEQRLSELCRACEQVQAHLPEATNIDPLQALAWPGVLQDTAPDHEALQAAAQATLEQALAQLAEVRGQEGQRLAELLQTRAQNVATLTAQVRQRLPEVQRAWRERLDARLEELTIEVDPGRLEQELALQAQKADVDEELTRLDSHVQALEEALGRQEPVGRRLDFLMQEFNREANTLSSKSQDAEVTQCAVEMKVLIEQMREQIQNIE